MKRSHHIRFVFVMFLFVGQIFTSLVKADDVSDYVVIKQDLQYVNIFADNYFDTCVRTYNYSANGFLQTVIDTPKSEYYFSYIAEYDTIGRIKRYEEYRDSLVNITEFVWEPENRIKYKTQWFEKKWYEEVTTLETGTIVYHGKLRSVDLPENTPMSVVNGLTVRADSTQFFDESGNLIVTWLFEFDSYDNVIKWQSREPGASELKYVQEYSYRYYNGGFIEFKSGSLDGIPIVYYFYEKPTKIQFYQKQAANKNVFTSQNPLSAGYYLVNGQKLGKISHKNNRNLPLMILVDPTQKQKTKLSLPRK